MNSGQTAEPPVVFRLERSELTAQFHFASPYWLLATNIARVYAALLERMRDFGVSSQGMRSDVADGALGSFNVNFWILQYGAIVRLRLDSVEIYSPNLAVDTDQLERAYIALEQSLREADETTSYKSSEVTVAMHGRLENMEPTKFLERFVGNRPAGLGTAVGSGAVFYFENPPLTLSSITIDMSAVVAGGIFLKVQSVFDSTIKADALRTLATEQLERCVQALGLQLPPVGS